MVLSILLQKDQYHDPFRPRIFENIGESFVRAAAYLRVSRSPRHRHNTRPSYSQLIPETKWSLGLLDDPWVESELIKEIVQQWHELVLTVVALSECFDVLAPLIQLTGCLRGPAGVAEPPNGVPIAV